MTSLTTTQRLPYPVAGDTLKEQAERQQELAEAVDARLRLHRSAIALSKRPPFALMRLDTPTVIPFGTGDVEGDLVPFDHVEADTDQMTDLSLSAKRLFIHRLGYYQVGGYLHTLGTGCNPGLLDVTIQGSGGFTGFEIGNCTRETLQGFAALSVTGVCRRNSSSSVSSYLTLRVRTTGTCTGTSVTASQAKFWAYWVADL